MKRFEFVMANDVVVCTGERPFAALDGQCVGCNDGEIFFLDVGACSPCPANYTLFDSKTHTCVNQSSPTCTGNQLFNLDSKKC